jgi:hypothetical protein
MGEPGRRPSWHESLFSTEGVVIVLWLAFDAIVLAAILWGK